MNEFLAALWLKPSVLAAGFAGGLLRALSRQRFRWREVVVSPICGALAAGYLTDSVLHYVRTIGMEVHPADQVANNAAAFVIGACAMWLTDLVLERLVRWFKPREAGE